MGELFKEDHYCIEGIKLASVSEMCQLPRSLNCERYPTCYGPNKLSKTNLYMIVINAGYYIGLNGTEHHIRCNK